MHDASRSCVSALRAVAAAGLLAASLADARAATPAAGDESPPAASAAGTDESVVFDEFSSGFGASQYEQSVDEAPASVTIVTAEEIQRFGYRTLGEILRGVRGVYTTYDRNYSYMGVRGFSRPGDYNTRVQLLIDGHRLNENVFGMAPIGVELPLDVELISRVEVIRGPSSSLYGSSALFATINVVTKRGRDLRGGEVAASAASFRTATGRASYGDRGGSVEALASASGYATRGQDLYFPEFAAVNEGVAEGADGGSAYSAFAKVAAGELVLTAVHGSRAKEIPTAPWGTVFGDSRTRTWDTRTFVDLGHEHALGSGLETAARVYYDQYDYRGNYVYDYPPVTVSEDFGRGRWAGTEARVSHRARDVNRLTLGAEYRYNFAQDQGVYDLDPPFVYLADERSSAEWALFAQDELRIAAPLILNVGVRYDHYQTFGGAVSPRVAAILTPRRATTLKLVYGDAFRAPNVYELHYSDGVAMKPNPELEPERLRTFEVVVEQRLGRAVRATALVYYWKIHNLITQTTDPADGLQVFRNLDAAEAVGAEAEIEAQAEGVGTLRVSYAYARARDATTHETLSNAPRHLAQAAVSAPVWRDRVFAAVEAQYASPRETLVPGVSTPHLLLLRATVTLARLVRGLTLTLGVDNVLDQRYGDPGGDEHVQPAIEQDGRSVRAAAVLSF